MCTPSRHPMATSAAAYCLRNARCVLRTCGPSRAPRKSRTAELLSATLHSTIICCPCPLPPRVCCFACQPPPSSLLGLLPAQNLPNLPEPRTLRLSVGNCSVCTIHLELLHRVPGSSTTLVRAFWLSQAVASRHNLSCKAAATFSGEVH